MRCRLLFSATAIALSLSISAPAAAQERREVTTFLGGQARNDLIFGGLTLGALAGATFLLEPSTATTAPLDGLGHRPRDRTFDIASDTVLLAGLAGGVAMAWSTEYSRDRSGADLWRSTLIMGESVALALTIVQAIKNAGVCRPRDWVAAENRCDPELGEKKRTAEKRLNEAHSSFPSGHTAPLAALAGASAGMWLFPTGRNRDFMPVTVVTGSAALAMVALRPLAGAHSWVDTSTGFLIGSASGLLVSFLHTKKVAASASLGVSTSPVQVSLGASF